MLPYQNNQNQIMLEFANLRTRTNAHLYAVDRVTISGDPIRPRVTVERDIERDPESFCQRE